jgi:hypothetical protein
MLQYNVIITGREKQLISFMQKHKYKDTFDIGVGPISCMIRKDKHVWVAAGKSVLWIDPSVCLGRMEIRLNRMRDLVLIFSKDAPYNKIAERTHKNDT